MMDTSVSSAPVLAYSTLPLASPAVAQLRGVTKTYPNSVHALKGLDLTLHAGEIVALLGANGAGKSTAVKLMLGLSSPTSGTVRIFGADPRSQAARLRTGAMLQVGRAPETLRVREQLELFRGYYPAPLSMNELVRLAALGGIEDRLFGELSGGQKQRVLFALALAGDPDLVYLDEPTVGLDIEARRALWAAIRGLRERGKTVLLTTHYLEEADALADRIAVLRDGRIVSEGTPTQIKSAAAGLPHGKAQADGTEPAEVKQILCRTRLSAATLGAIAGVAHAETAALPCALLVSTAPAATLRELLALDTTLSELVVREPALEDAFLALTQMPN